LGGKHFGAHKRLYVSEWVEHCYTLALVLVDRLKQPPIWFAMLGWDPLMVVEFLGELFVAWQEELLLKIVVACR
jgi:predicted metallopeptidase